MKGIVEALQQIAELSKPLLETPEDDRISIYRKLDPLFLKLESHLKHAPNDPVATALSELRFHLILIARLDDPDGASDEEHYREALDLLAALQRTEWSEEAPSPQGA